MPELTAHQWFLAALAAVCVGLSKSGFGGIGMIAVLLMAQILPAKASTGAVLPMLIFADLFAVAAFSRHTVWAHVWRMLPPAIAGVVIGWIIMPLVPDLTFGSLIGWVSLILTGLVIVQRLAPALSHYAVTHPALAWPTGLLAGVTTMLANAAGPVMTLYLLACRLPKMEFVGTAAWFFLILNVSKVPFSASLGLIDRASLAMDTALLPGILLGVGVGKFFLGRINQTLFETILILFALAGSLKLILAG